MNTANGNGHTPNPIMDLPPTSASEWRKARQEGYTITLPSDNRATIRPVPLDQLVKNGTIPDFLTPVAARSLWSESDSNAIAADLDLHHQFIELIDIIVPLAMLKPKVVIDNPDPKKEEISLSDLDFMDKVAIFNLAIQPTAVLKNFRKQQEERLANSHSSEDIQFETEPAPQN